MAAATEGGCTAGSAQITYIVGKSSTQTATVTDDRGDTATGSVSTSWPAP